MAQERVDEELVRIDRLSKLVALFFAIGLFVLASLFTDHVQFNASVAAVGAIGIRLYIPYHASLSGYGPDTVPSEAHPETGNYNHGAVGAGLVVGSFAAIGGMVVGSNYFAGLASGVGVALLTYLVFDRALPSGGA